MAVLVILGMSAFAQAEPPKVQRVLDKMVFANMFEIQSSRIALNRSRNPEVKLFANQMIQEHGADAAELNSVAKLQNLTVPIQLNPKHQKMVDQLNSAAEDAFDATFIRLQTEEHMGVINMLKRYSKNGENEAVRAFAQRVLPVLRSHYKELEKISGNQSSNGDN